MWFRKQSRADGPDNPHPGNASDGYLITEETLVRGTVSMRRGKPIRQIGVTVQGSTVMVTTGDIVDQEVYDALVAVGALNVPHNVPHALERTPAGPDTEAVHAVEDPPGA